MKRLISILITAILCASAAAQTIRTLGYNTTNGQVVANTGTNVLTFTNEEISVVGISDESVLVWDVPNNTFQIETSFGAAFCFVGTNSLNSAAISRTNLSLGLPALTNTSNVTMMRALAGSTNTNNPYSGTIVFPDFDDMTHTIVVSNGIITSYTAP